MPTSLQLSPAVVAILSKYLAKSERGKAELAVLLIELDENRTSMYKKCRKLVKNWSSHIQFLSKKTG